MNIDFYTEKKLEIYFNYEPRLREAFMYVLKPERKNEDWEYIYSYVKTHFKIQELVGFYAQAIELRKVECYDFVIKTLTDLIWDNSKDDSIIIEDDCNG